MRRHSECSLSRAMPLGLAAAASALACGEDEHTIHNLRGGPDAVQSLPMPRVPSFAVGGDRGSVAVLGRGRRIYTVATLDARVGPGMAASSPGACLLHSARRLLTPGSSSATLVAEGIGPPVTVEVAVREATRSAPVARNRATVLWDAAQVAEHPSALEFPAPLAGAALSEDRLFLFTAFSQVTELWCHDGFAADGVTAVCSEADTSRAEGAGEQSLLASVRGEQLRTLALPFEIAAVHATPNGDYVVRSEAGNELLELRADTLAQSCAEPGDGCGIVVAHAGGCARHLVPRGAAEDVASPIACDSSWGRVVVSENGCTAALIQTHTGQGLVVSLPGSGCLAQRFPDYPISAAAVGEPTGSDFRVVLSPNGLWAAVHPAGTSEVPVTLLALQDGTAKATSILRPQSLEFACAPDSGECTLWALHDGTHSLPAVTALPVSTGTAHSCPSRLPIKSFRVASPRRATFLGADSFGQAQLTHVDLGAASCSAALPLAFLPVCHGVAGEGQSFVCAPDRDGDVQRITWTEPPTVAHFQQFSLENRSSGEDCQ